MIALQAEVARHLLRSEPDQADTALGHIRHAGRDVLDELSSLLYVLRQPDDGTHAAHPVTSARVGTASQRAGNSVEVLLSRYAPWRAATRESVCTRSGLVVCAPDSLKQSRNRRRSAADWVLMKGDASCDAQEVCLPGSRCCSS